MPTGWCFANHMHGFDAGDWVASATKSFKSEHGGEYLICGPVVLLNDIVDVLRLAQRDGNTASALMLTMAASLEPLLSRATFSGMPLKPIACSKIAQSDSPRYCQQHGTGVST